MHSSQNNASPVEVIVHDQISSESLASHKGNSDQQLQFTVDSPSLWSPETPTLYNITVRLGDDEITSYTGFRTITKGEEKGIVRPLLNGKFVFQFGTLDQGYWPDGIYTPPSKEAMISDLHILKKLGFNAVRKHVSPSYDPIMHKQLLPCADPYFFIKRLKSSLPYFTEPAMN